MSAPLYSRYRRYADREARRFKRGSFFYNLLTTWKNPKTRVYSLSDNASYEAGAWSGNPPGEILRGMDNHVMPANRVWIELDFRMMMRGSTRTPKDQDHIPVTGVGVGNFVSDTEMPVRVGFMLCATNAHGTPRDANTSDPSQSAVVTGLMFYLYASGASFIGPPLAMWSLNGKPFDPLVMEEVEGKEDAPLKYNDTTYSLRDMALSHSYRDRFAYQNPRLFSRLRERVVLTSVAVPRSSGTGSLLDYKKDRLSSLLGVQGTTRLMIAAMTACMAAQRPKPEDRDAPLSIVERNPQRASKTPIEVDLFLRNSPKHPGKSIRRSVGHMEGIRKGLHTVGAHYAYRNRKDGADPRICEKTEFGNHDWERIEGTKSQVCILCGQKRWYKAQHDRGDEAYGVSPQKMYNVRSGEPIPETPDTPHAPHAPDAPHTSIKEKAE